MTERRERDESRPESLPDHEYRETEGEAVGGGVLGSGGTAVDRGTGTLGGTAQGPEADDDETGTLEDPVVGGNETLVEAQAAADLQTRDTVDPAR